MSRARRVKGARRATRARMRVRARATRGSALSFKVSPQVDAAIQKLAAEGRKVAVLGTVKNGRLEISPQGLRALGRLLPNSKIGFIALNAPFRTRIETHAL